MADFHLSTEAMNREQFESSSDEDIGGNDSDLDCIPDEPYIADSDSDVHLGSDSENDPDTVAKPEGYYLGRSHKPWSKIPPPQTSKTTNCHLPGCKGIAKETATPGEAFMCFFDDSVIEMIVTNTNTLIDNIRTNFTRERDARCTDCIEMKAFIGLVLFSGVLRSSYSNVKDLFASDGTGPEVYRNTMSYTRFLFLMRCLRFDNIHDRRVRMQIDKLAPIRQLFEQVVERCSSLFTPGEHLTVGCHRKFGYQQYLPLKPTKYGVKIYTIVDTRTFYNLKMELYVGNQPDGPFKLGNTNEIVVRLVTPVSETGRNVTVDGRFTSVALAETLLTEHNVTMVGLMRKDNADIPREFLPNRRRDVNSCVFGYADKCTIVSFVPQKQKAIVVLSSLHHDERLDESGMPEIVSFYNSTKEGVDKHDQLCAMYDAGRRTRRWPLAVFFHLLNVVGINSQIIYNFNREDREKLRRRDFLKKLTLSLTSPHRLRRSQDEHLPTQIRDRLRASTDLRIPEKVVECSKSFRSRCYICPRKANRMTSVRCVTCNRHICGEHLTNVCNKCLFN